MTRAVTENQPIMHNTPITRCPTCNRISVRVDHLPERSKAVCLDGHEWDPFAVFCGEVYAVGPDLFRCMKPKGHAAHV